MIAWTVCDFLEFIQPVRKSEQMKCLRCQGMMVPHTMEDAGASTSSGSSPGWKCLLCGEVIDAVIAANRRCRPEPSNDRTRPRYLIHAGGSKRKSSRN